MSPVRPCRGARWLLAASLLVLAAITASACDAVPGFSNGSGEVRQEATPVADHGPCLPTYGSRVEAVSMSSNGTRIAYLSAERPSALPDGASWLRNDRAVHLLEQLGAASTGTRLLVIPWPSRDNDVIPVYPTDDPRDPAPPQASQLREQLVWLAIAHSGDRLLLGVERTGVKGGMAKLYSGLIPEGTDQLQPDGGLTVVPINDFRGTEGVRNVALSPDGSKLAGVVGPQGELRVFDFAEDRLYVYSTAEDGSVDVTHDLPPAASTLDLVRSAAFAHPGMLRLSWAPDSRRLAVSRNESVGVAGLWILDVESGEATLVRTFSNTTVPHTVWSADGASLFVMSTRLFQGNSFGDSELRRIEAKGDGRDVGDRWELKQVPGSRTAPADLVGYGDDSNFVFTWEEQAWLLEVPASGSGDAVYGPLTLSPPLMRVPSGNVSVSAAQDRVAFLVRDGAGTHVGIRLAATQATCPEGGAPPQGPAPADQEPEPEADVEAETEQGEQGEQGEP